MVGKTIMIVNILISCLSCPLGNVPVIMIILLIYILRISTLNKSSRNCLTHEYGTRHEKNRARYNITPIHFLARDTLYIGYQHVRRPNVLGGGV